jgi:hypothetical protein
MKNGEFAKTPLIKITSKVIQQEIKLPINTSENKNRFPFTLGLKLAYFTLFYNIYKFTNCNIHQANYLLN